MASQKILFASGAAFSAARFMLISNASTWGTISSCSDKLLDPLNSIRKRDFDLRVFVVPPHLRNGLYGIASANLESLFESIDHLAVGQTFVSIDGFLYAPKKITESSMTFCNLKFIRLTKNIFSFSSPINTS
jgi:hypothetical protein